MYDSKLNVFVFSSWYPVTPQFKEDIKINTCCPPYWFKYFKLIIHLDKLLYRVSLHLIPIACQLSGADLYLVTIRDTGTYPNLWVICPSSHHRVYDDPVHYRTDSANPPSHYQRHSYSCFYDVTSAKPVLNSDWLTDWLTNRLTNKGVTVDLGIVMPWSCRSNAQLVHKESWIQIPEKSMVGSGRVSIPEQYGPPANSNTLHRE